MYGRFIFLRFHVVLFLDLNSCLIFSHDKCCVSVWTPSVSEERNAKLAIHRAVGGGKERGQ